MTKITDRKKQPHKLHHCSNSKDFMKQMLEAGVDLPLLIAEIIDPTYPIGVVLGGSIPERTATAISDVDITLLLTDQKCLKPFSNEIWGHSVFHLHKDPQKSANWIVIIYKGIEINFELKLNKNVLSDNPNASQGVDIHTEDINELRFLSRLTSGWPLLNHDLVIAWREYYKVDNLREQRTISEFTLALKELEDMKAAISGAGGLVQILGVHITTRLIKSILATESYFSPGLKWMRKVNQLIKHNNGPCAQVLSVAKPLLFPRYSEDEKDQLDYYHAIIRLTKLTEEHIVSCNHYVGDVLEWFKQEFDMLND